MSHVNPSILPPSVARFIIDPARLARLTEEPDSAIEARLRAMIHWVELDTPPEEVVQNMQAMFDLAFEGRELPDEGLMYRLCLVAWLHTSMMMANIAIAMREGRNPGFLDAIGYRRPLPDALQTPVG